MRSSSATRCAATSARSIRYKEPVVDVVPRAAAGHAGAGGAALVDRARARHSGRRDLGQSSATRWIDTLVRVLALFGQAVPGFYLGLMLIIIVAVQWRLLPTSGRGDPAQLVLPAITLAAAIVALLARFTRGAVLDVVRQDFVRTGARQRACRSSWSCDATCMKNAMIPIVTVIGLQVGQLFSGAVVTETVFAWPGIGRLMVQAIYTRDFPIVQATVMIVALIFVLVNLLVDLTYAWLDPRIKYG